MPPCFPFKYYFRGKLIGTVRFATINFPGVEVKGRVFMNKSKFFLVFLLVVLLLSAITTAGIYKWVNEKGETHYSDTPPKDSESKGKVKVIPTYKLKSQPRTNSSDKNRNPGSSSYGQTLNPEKSQERQVADVELYTTSWCGYCKKARNFFQSRGIPFTEYDIEKDESAARRKKRLDSRRGVPFAVINGQQIHGYSEAAYERALLLEQ